MKISVQQSVVQHSRNFLKNVASKLPEGIKDFYISGFGMNRATGYGSYNYVMDVHINPMPIQGGLAMGGIHIRLKKFTHDSVDFDYYTDLEYQSHNFNNWAKRRMLSMLSDETIHDKIRETIEESKNE